MTGITEALSDWKKRAQVLDTYPIVWAAHYSGQSKLGEFTIPALPEGDNPVGKVIHAGMFPFALTPAVQSSYLIIDEEAVFGPRRRRLLVGRLLALSEGVLASHWQVRYGISDRGDVYTGTPNQEMPSNREVWDTFTDIMNQRLALGVSVSFDEAWIASSERFRELMS
jgi:hypothetical protein